MILLVSYYYYKGGTSTNGAKHKIAGRVGDSPIVGSGSYVDNEVFKYIYRLVLLLQLVMVIL